MSMSNIEDEFSVHLMFGDAEALQNKYADYVIPRMEPLELLPENEWEVAIISCDFPLSSVDICGYDDVKLGLYRTTVEGVEEFAACTFKNVKPVSDPGQFVKQLKAQIQTSQSLRDYFGGEHVIPIQFSYDSANHRVGVLFNDATPGLAVNRMALSDMLCRKLGFSVNRQMPIDAGPNITYGELNPFIFVGDEFVLVELGSLVKEKTLVNNDWSRISLQIPIHYDEFATGSTHVAHDALIKRRYEIANPLYVDVAKRSIAKWEIRLLNERLHLIRWQAYELGTLTVLLHFRRRNPFKSARE